MRIEVRGGGWSAQDGNMLMIIKHKIQHMKHLLQYRAATTILFSFWIWSFGPEWTTLILFARMKKTKYQIGKKLPLTKCQRHGFWNLCHKDTLRTESDTCCKNVLQQRATTKCYNNNTKPNPHKCQKSLLLMGFSTSNKNVSEHLTHCVRVDICVGQGFHGQWHNRGHSDNIDTPVAKSTLATCPNASHHHWRPFLWCWYLHIIVGCSWFQKSHVLYDDDVRTPLLDVTLQLPQQLLKVSAHENY